MELVLIDGGWSSEGEEVSADQADRLPTPYEANLPPQVRRWLFTAPGSPSLEALIEGALRKAA